MSLGSHGSAVSGLSGFTNSQLGGSLLSGVSDGVSSLTAGDASYRRSLAAAYNNAQAQQLANLNGANNAAAMAAMNNNSGMVMNLNNNNNNNNNNLGPPAVGMFQNVNRNPGCGGSAMGSGNSVFSGSRGSNGFNNYSITSGSGRSDLSGQTMPQAAAIFGRTSSHNDLGTLLRDDMSMADHSLLGGGLGANSFRQLNQQYQQQQQQQQFQQQLLLQQQAQQLQQQQVQVAQQQQAQQHQLELQQQQMQQAQRQAQHQQQQLAQLQEHEHSHLDGMDSSAMSGFSFSSNNRSNRHNYKDGMDFSVFSGASLANSLTNRSSARGAAPYAPAAARYARGDQSVSARSHVSNYSIGAMSQSIASMSLHSGASVASFSAHSHMSDFSETLLALDLAETSSRGL